MSESDIDLYKSLLVPDVNTIQEKDFVKYFLPLFASTEKNAPVAEWLHVAGNAHAPVNVMRGTEFLFQVPPLLGDAAFISIMGGREHSISEIVATAQRMADISPNYGENHLREALDGRVVDSHPDVEKAKQWNLIFDRYGIERIHIENEKATAAGPTTHGSSEQPIAGIEEF